MKNILFTLVCIFSLASVKAQTPIWVNSIGSSSNDEGRTIKVAPNGNVCVAGKFMGTMDLDPGPGVYNITSNGFDDIYLACYTSTGAFLWGFNVGGNLYDAAWYITIDESNDIYICGYFQSAGIDFDPGPGVSTIPFTGGTTLTYYGDGFVAKYSGTGAFLWAKDLGGSTPYDVTLSLDTDPSGNVYVGGVFNTSMYVSPTITLTSITDGTAYLIKYDPSGTVLWAHNYGLPGISSVDCFPRSLQENGGFIYVTGFFQGTSNFNPWGVAAPLTSSGTYDFYVAKYDVAGNFIWVRQVIGSAAIDEFYSLALDAADNVYVLGRTNSGTVIFDPLFAASTTVLSPGGGGNNDVVIAKFNSSGTYQWGKVIGGTGNDFGYGIDVSGSSVFCTGYFGGTVDFDPLGPAGSLTSTGLTDIFVVQYDLNGNYLCSFSAGSAGANDAGYGVTHDATGNILITGQYGGTSVDFDPSPSATLPLTSVGGADAYFGKYDPVCLSASSVICNTLTVPDTLHLCVGDTSTIFATIGGTDSVLSYAWTPPSGLSSTTILNPVVTAVLPGYYYLTMRSLNQANLVVNGNFSLGNTGFSSSYTYAPPPSATLIEGNYSVYTNPFGVHTGFTSMGDHTTGTGNMMIINGGPTAVDVWCQTIAVTPNTDYTFSAWFANCSSVTIGPDVPILQFRINGILQGTPATVTAAPGVWVNFSTTWNSGLSTSASICIYDAVTTAAGNDFVIDDIAFRQICSITDSVYIDVTVPDTTYTVHDTDLCNSALPYTLTAPSGYVTYQWSTGSASPTSIGITSGGTYWVTAYGGCRYVSDTFKIGLFSSPVVFIGNDTGFCSGNTLILSSPQPTGSTWSWSTGATTDTIHVSTSGLYSVTVTNSDGCSTDDFINISVGPPPVVDLGPDTVACDGHPILLMSSVTYTTPAYQWHDFTTGPTFTATTTGTYWLQVTESGCSGADTVHVEIKYDTFTLYNVDTAICKGASLQVYATGDPNIHFQWLPTTGIATPTLINPLITTDTSAMYVLYGYQDGCPVLMDSFYLDVQPNPDPFLGVNRRVCQYDTVRIVSSVDPGWYTHYTYSWSPSAFLDHTNLPSAVFTAGTTTNIKLTVTTPAGCMGIDSVMAVVYPGDFATISNDTIVCPHDTLHLTATGGIQYQWTPATYLNDASLASPLASPITTITYTMLATSADGCTDTLNVNVAVKPAAVIHMEDSVTIYPGESYQISPETNGTSFIWTPSGGLNGKYLANPIASPEVSTRYIVNTVTEHGCKAMDSIYIFVDDNSLIGVPNAFTPGAGTNDKLYIIKRGLVNLKHFNIYNRWGNLVFTTTDLDAGWDGTYKGVPQPLGVFVYTIEAVTRTGKTITKSGNVTLLR
jgi:gliding motility-associated-like protein